MSIRATSWAWTVQTSPTAKLVLVALADFADEVGHCWPRLVLLEEMTGLSERAARNALRQLEAEKHIRTERAVGRGHSSRYRLLINEPREKGHDMPVSGDEEKGHLVPKKGHLLPEKGHLVPEKGQEMPPEPSRTIKNRQEPPREVRQAPSEVLPAWLPPTAWTEWCSYRRTISGKKWTQAAAVKSIGVLSRLRDEGHDPSSVIDQSIASGWTGLFPLKSNARASSQPTSKLGWMLNQ